MAKSPRKAQPLPKKRASIKRDEITDLEGFMIEFDIKDKRTAENLLRAIGLNPRPQKGSSKVLITGEAIFLAVRELEDGKT